MSNIVKIKEACEFIRARVATTDMSRDKLVLLVKEVIASI